MRKPSYEISQEELTLISQYLYNELDETAMQSFEKQLKDDEILQQKVEEVKLLIIGVREADLKNTLNEFHSTLEPAVVTEKNIVKNINRQRNWWAVAASVAILIVAGVWWIQSAEKSSENLYKTYFVKDMGLPVEMSNADSARYWLYDGMISYKEADYDKALRKWKDVTASNDTLQYYSALALMNLNRHEEAVKLLQTITGVQTSGFYENAVWYLALCELKLNRRENAVEWLQRIPKNKQAQSLLKKIE